MRSYYAAFVPDEGNTLSVIFPDVPGCATWGNTEAEAFAHAVDALEGHLEALADDGDEIPEPSDKAGAWDRLRAFAAEVDMHLPADTVLQLVPAPDLSRTVKATMSFKEGTLEMIDRKAEALGMKRSVFVAAAARYYPVSGADHPQSEQG